MLASMKAQRTIEDPLAAAILAAVAARGPGKSVCPSEIARALAPDWRSLMPAVRATAARLAAAGLLRVTQKGATVDALTARGPIRLAAPE
jgi:hypothetical protein